MEEFYINLTVEEYNYLKELMVKSNKEFEFESQYRYMPDDDYREMLFFKKFIEKELNEKGGLIQITIYESDLRDIRLLTKIAFTKNTNSEFHETLFNKFDFVESKPVEFEGEVSDKYTNDNVIYFKKINFLKG